MLERTIKPIALAVGTVFAAALGAAAVADTDSGLFAVDEVDQGYDRLADAHGDDDKEEGSCGEGTCGDDGDDDGDDAEMDDDADDDMDDDDDDDDGE